MTIVHPGRCRFLSPLLFCSLSLALLLGCSRTQTETTFCGYQPPGLEPVPFAPEILTAQVRPHGPLCISPNLSLFCFSGYRIGEGRAETIYESQCTGTVLQPPVRVPFAGPDGFGATAFGPDGRMLYLSAMLPFPGDTVGANTNYSIWLVEKTAEGWSGLAPVTVTQDTSWLAMRPTVARNGNLYFVARYKNERQPKIYCAKWVDGAYAAPIPLNDRINATPSADPFIDPEERFLLFLGDFRPGGLGKSDLYISFRTDDGGDWDEPINLGPTINTPEFERSPSLSPDGKYLFFIRAVGQQFVQADAQYYWVSAEILDSLRP